MEKLDNKGFPFETLGSLLDPGMKEMSGQQRPEPKLITEQIMNSVDASQAEWESSAMGEMPRSDAEKSESSTQGHKSIENKFCPSNNDTNRLSIQNTLSLLPHTENDRNTPTENQFSSFFSGSIQEKSGVCDNSTQSTHSISEKVALQSTMDKGSAEPSTSLEAMGFDVDRKVDANSTLPGCSVNSNCPSSGTNQLPDSSLSEADPSGVQFQPFVPAHPSRESSSLSLPKEENCSNSISAENPVTSSFQQDSKPMILRSCLSSNPNNVNECQSGNEQEGTFDGPSGCPLDQEEPDFERNDSKISIASKDQEQSPCRILTQYVFINRPKKKKSVKKKFGVPYKTCGTMKFSVALGKRKKGKMKEKVVKSTNCDREERIMKRDRVKESAAWTESAPNERNSSRLESRKSRNSKSSKKESVVESAAWKNSKKAERSGKKVVKTGTSAKRRLLSSREKVDVKNALKLPGATVDSVSAEFGVAKTILRKLCKELKKETVHVAEKKNRKKITQEKSIDIKEEAQDDPLFWEIHSSFQQLDDVPENEISDGFEPRHRKSLRLRKELTLDQKVMVIQDLQAGCKVTHVAKKYGISSSSVSRLNKHQHSILFKAESGDVCRQMKRTRDCKAPELDKALLKWYRSVEKVCSHPVSLSNVLLREKSHDIAMAMGCTYFPTTNWIIRWKYRHNVVGKQGRIEIKEELDEFDKHVDLADILSEVDKQLMLPEGMFNPDGTLIDGRIKKEKADEIFICEHCGVVCQGAPGRRRRNKKRTIHLKECPLYAHRRDLTLAEKVKVVRALEKPGIKMVQLAKKFCISTSAISRIHKDRIDILARFNEGYINMDRKRSRVSKEPEVERALCDWYRTQQELGIHISSHMVREKAKEIATTMGKDFCPSDSWVFRWRHRNNVNGVVEYEESEEDDQDEMGDSGDLNDCKNEPQVCDESRSVMEDGIPDHKDGECENEDCKGKRKRKRKSKSGDDDIEEPKRKQIVFPRSVMCEKCGCVSVRLKNNRIRNMRHSKGCPMLRPRHEMTYEERIKMLAELEEPGATLSSVARKYGVSTSSMSRMKQNKEVIINQGQERKNQKRIRDCKEPEVAKKLYSWYLEKQSKGTHVTGTKLKEKASKMAMEEGREFKVSTGWLGRWKHRYNIIFKTKEAKDKVKKVAPKRKNQKKPEKPVYEPEELQVSTEYPLQNDVNNMGIADVAQTIQPPRMFFTPRYHQNPWDLAQQASTSCARPKDFIATVTHAIPPEDNQGQYTYDHIATTTRMFHHTFETFALSNGYPVGMGVGGDPALAARDFLQPEEEEVNQQGVGIPSSSSSSISAVASTTSHPPHSLLHHHTSAPHMSQAQTSSLITHHHSHPQHHLPLHQQHPPSIPNMQQHHHQQPQQLQQQQQQPPQHSASSTSMMVPDEDNEQESQVMEAIKIMSSFAQKKSLGADVQAALRTIEMTMKNAGGGGMGGGKGIKRNTYTNI